MLENLEDIANILPWTWSLPWEDKHHMNAFMVFIILQLQYNHTDVSSYMDYGMAYQINNLCFNSTKLVP